MALARNCHVNAIILSLLSFIVFVLS